MSKLLINFSSIKSKERFNFHKSDIIQINKIPDTRIIEKSKNALEIEINNLTVEIFQSKSVFNYKILYCVGLPDSTTYDDIQPLISPYYDSLSMIRYITTTKKEKNKISEEENSDSGLNSIIFYFDSVSIARNFYRELNNLEMNNFGERLYFVRCENVIVYEDFSIVKPFLYSHFAIPNCINCLLKLDEEACQLNMKGFLKIEFRKI